MTKLISLFFLLFFGACVSTTDIKPNQEISIEAGGESNFILNKEKITFKLLEVLDSRCPEGVQCIRAGEAVVKFDISIEKENYLGQEICLQCGEIEGISDIIQLGSHTLQLKEVNPRPTTENQNDIKSAIFVFM
ncbi:MAG: hypothetical protein ACI9QN_000133 [Arcticibacterium sp.]|jgi:hypothetical protein